LIHPSIFDLSIYACEKSSIEKRLNGSFSSIPLGGCVGCAFDILRGYEQMKLQL